jgi:hypothetical protein
MKDVSRVYMYGLSNKGDSLTVEVYFRTDKPKLVLEFYHTDGKLLQHFHDRIRYEQTLFT